MGRDARPEELTADAQPESSPPLDAAGHPTVSEATGAPEVSSSDPGDNGLRGVSAIAAQAIGGTAEYFSPRADRASVSTAEKRAALAWVGSVIERPELEGAELEVLRDGTVLCELANAIRPVKLSSGLLLTT